MYNRLLTLKLLKETGLNICKVFSLSQQKLLLSFANHFFLIVSADLSSFAVFTPSFFIFLSVAFNWLNDVDLWYLFLISDFKGIVFGITIFKVQACVDIIWYCCGCCQGKFVSFSSWYKSGILFCDVFGYDRKEFIYVLWGCIFISIAVIDIAGNFWVLIVWSCWYCDSCWFTELPVWSCLGERQIFMEFVVVSAITSNTTGFKTVEKLICKIAWVIWLFYACVLVKTVFVCLGVACCGGIIYSLTSNSNFSTSSINVDVCKLNIFNGFFSLTIANLISAYNVIVYQHQDILHYQIIQGLCKQEKINTNSFRKCQIYRIL